MLVSTTYLSNSRLFHRESGQHSRASPRGTALLANNLGIRAQIEFEALARRSDYDGHCCRGTMGVSDWRANNKSIILASEKGGETNPRGHCLFSIKASMKNEA